MRAKKLLRILGLMVLLQGLATLAGQMISRKLSAGDEGSNDFTIAAIMFGKKFESHAAELKSGTAIAAMGGAELDLRDAKLDPAGADLEIKTTMGGVQILVPEDWAVDVDAENKAGAFEVNVTPHDQLPEDAPKLHIHAVTMLGGGLVTTKAA